MTILNIVKLTTLNYDAIREHYIRDFIIIDGQNFKLCDVKPNTKDTNNPYLVYLRKISIDTNGRSIYGKKVIYNCNTKCSVKYRGVKVINDLPTLCEQWVNRKYEF